MMKSTQRRSLFENEISTLTKPINGQYPRPWMSDLTQPENAKVLIVGMNPATAYTMQHVKSHSQFMDVHFNRNGENCRSFYAYVRGKGDQNPSPSRLTIETLTEKFVNNEISEILETNIYCYATPNFKDLKKNHPKGKEIGHKIFKAVIDGVRPKILVIHGVQVRKEFGKNFDVTIPTFPMEKGKPIKTTKLFKSEVLFETHSSIVFVIPSLSAPGANHWQNWADDYLNRVAKGVKRFLK